MVLAARHRMTDYCHQPTHIYRDLRLVDDGIYIAANIIAQSYSDERCGAVEYFCYGLLSTNNAQQRAK